MLNILLSHLPPLLLVDWTLKPMARFADHCFFFSSSFSSSPLLLLFLLWPLLLLIYVALLVYIWVFDAELLLYFQCFLFKSIGINTFPLYWLERLLVQWESNLTQPASDAKKLNSIRFIIHISRVKLLAWTPVSPGVNHQKHGWRDAIWPIPKLRLNRAGQRLVLRRPAQFLENVFLYLSSFANSYLFDF